VLDGQLLPQFISEGDPVFAKSLLLAGLFVAIGMTWLVVYVHLVDVVARSLGSAEASRRSAARS
jgi:threonine/homoserine/homoserine lactone efflux protein